MSFNRSSKKKQNQRPKGSILGYKDFGRYVGVGVREVGSEMTGCLDKLLEVQKLTETVQFTLQTCREKAARY